MARVPRVHVPGIAAPGPLVLEGDQARRLTSVLRLRVGDALLLFDAGAAWDAVVASVGKARVEVTVGELNRREPPPAPRIGLWCALVRPQRFDWMVEKATEAGADVIVPFASAYTARGDRPSSDRLGRWQRIAIEAAEQSARLTVPEIAPAATFDALLAEDAPRLVCHPGGEPLLHVCEALRDAGRLLLAVGPEGGFSEAEAEQAEGAGARLVALAPGILRTETAAIVSTAIVRAAFHSFAPAT